MAKPTLQRTNSSPKDSAPIPDSPTKESSNSVNLKDSAPLQPVISPRIKGIRSRIQRFTSSWFSVTMGTGICNTLLFDLPFAAAHPAFRGIGAAFLVFDIFLFILFASISIARYAMYPKIFRAMLVNETHSLFLGTIPMGMVTITSGIARTGTEYGIEGSLTAGIVLWWISLVVSVWTSFWVPYMMFTQHNNSTENLTAAWLLPIVPPITIGAVGSSLCALLLNQTSPPSIASINLALTILLASYIMLGVGLLLACGLMVIYFQRLAVHHLPGREVIVSTFLPLGPCGQGGFALIELGRVTLTLFPLLASTNSKSLELSQLALIGPSMFGSGLVSGLLLWGLGIWWTFLAVMSVGSNYRRKVLDFNMGFWGFTFPLGSMTLLTFSLGQTFDSLFFNVLGTIMTFSVVALWFFVAIPTFIGFFAGSLFSAPCLASLPPGYTEGNNGDGEVGIERFLKK